MLTPRNQVLAPIVYRSDSGYGSKKTSVATSQHGSSSSSPNKCSSWWKVMSSVGPGSGNRESGRTIPIFQSSGSSCSPNKHSHQGAMSSIGSDTGISMSTLTSQSGSSSHSPNKHSMSCTTCRPTNAYYNISIICRQFVWEIYIWPYQPLFLHILFDQHYIDIYLDLL